MENKVREMLSRYPLSEKERLYLKTDAVTEENQFQIKWLGENDVDEFNRHQKLCGKNTVEDDFLCDENARYCLLYADGIPAARGAIEKLSDDIWEVSDIYTAKAYRGKGLCTEVVKFICGEISANGKIITCRTRDDNESMKRVLEKTGFEVFDTIELIDYSEKFYSETIYAIAQFYGFHRQLSEENVVITTESLEMAKENIELWTGTDHELKVILFNNTFAGFVHIGYRGSNVAWIEDIYVDDKFRNKGIGTRAINLAEEIIKSKHGYTAICMDVVPRNINALNLYRSLGYDTLSMITVRKELYENNKDKTMYLLGIEFRY